MGGGWVEGFWSKQKKQSVKRVGGIKNMKAIFSPKTILKNFE